MKLEQNLAALEEGVPSPLMCSWPARILVGQVSKQTFMHLGPSPSPAFLFFSVSCLKRFPDTPKIHTMVLQGFYFNCFTLTAQ